MVPYLPSPVAAWEQVLLDWPIAGSGRVSKPKYSSLIVFLLSTVPALLCRLLNSPGGFNQYFHLHRTLQLHLSFKIIHRPSTLASGIKFPAKRNSLSHFVKFCH